MSVAKEPEYKVKTKKYEVGGEVIDFPGREK